MTEGEHVLDIKVNLDGIVGRVQRSLMVASRMMSIGLNAPIPPSHEIPGVKIQQNFGVPKWTREETVEGWTIWLLRNGFRELAEGIASILDEVHGVLALWKLIGTQQERPLTGADWNTIITERSIVFHKRGLPGKIDALKRAHGFELEAETTRQLLSINRARNCLAHRGGVVSSFDVDEAKRLVVAWNALVPIALREDGTETEVTPGSVVEGPAKLAIGVRARERAFVVGEHLSFTANEFSEICFSLFRFAAWCSQHLTDVGKARGVEFTPITLDPASGEERGESIKDSQTRSDE